MLLFVMIPAIVFAQTGSEAFLPPVPSGTYTWKTPAKGVEKNIHKTNILTGSGADMEYLAMDACSLSASGRRTTFNVPADEEHLYLIKSGIMNIAFSDSSWSIGPGSIALLMPGEKISIRGEGHGECRYYLMRYRSKDPVDLAGGKSSGGSFVMNWNDLTFRQHDRGGVRSYFQKATAMSKRLEMHVTTLKPGLKSHDPHTHHAEEIILMLEDTKEGSARTEMLIGDNSFKGAAGDFYYVGSGLLHGIRNTGEVTCSYFAFQFE
jgi:(S)-ureidoglycine aminohydrolase